MTNQTRDSADAVEVLLPCPFCGGEAERYTISEDEPDNAGGDVIACTRCQASSHVEFGRKENLVSCWNSRLSALSATPSTSDALREAAQAVLNSAERPGSRVEYGVDPKTGAETWHDYKEVLQRRLDDLQAALATPSPSEAMVERMREALEDFCKAAEYSAGCDEGVTPDTASSEIMSWAGSWMASAYDKGRAALTNEVKS